MANRQLGLCIGFSTKHEYFEDTDLITGEIKLTASTGTAGKNRAFAPLSAGQLKKLEAYKGGRYADSTSGFVALLIDTKNRRIMWSNFHPFGIIHEKAPKQMGIGAAVHHAITEYLAHRFPSHTIVHSGITAERREQLKKMGINPRRAYSIEEYQRIVRNYMERKKEEKTKKV